MHARGLGLVAIVALALGGCAAPMMQKAPGASTMSTFDCTGVGDCKCEVKVVCPAGGPCEARVKWDLMRARGHTIRWHIANEPGQSYAFDRDRGIEFKTAEGKRAFRCHALGNGDFQCQGDRNGNTYEYAIHVTGTPPVPPLDPFVVNN